MLDNKKGGPGGGPGGGEKSGIGGGKLVLVVILWVPAAAATFAYLLHTTVCHLL